MSPHAKVFRPVTAKPVEPIRSLEKKVYILRGLPGSGRSIFAQKMVKNMGAVVHGTDRYFLNTEGQIVFEIEKLGENHRRNYEAFCGSLKRGDKIVVLDNPNILREHYAPYVTVGHQHGYEVIEIVIGCFTEEFINVCAKRNTLGLHRETIHRMAVTFEK